MVYVNEMTYDGHLIGYAKRWLSVGVLPAPNVLKWVLATPQRPIIWLESWDFEPHDTSLIFKDGRKVKIECGPWFNQACPLNKASKKYLVNNAPISFLGWQHSVCELQHVDTRRTRRHWVHGALVWSPLGPRFCPLHLFLWLVLFCVLCYNKIVIIYIIIISWVMWVILPNYQTGESPWDSWIFSQLVWTKDGSGNPHTCRWCQKSWEDLVVWRTVPFTFSWSGWIWYAGAGINRIWWLTGS